MEAADIFVAVGSNIDPERNIPAAVRRLSGLADLVAVSTFYRTRPLDRPEQADFRNGMVWIRAALERDRVERDLLKPIEAELGRVRAADKHAPRTIDLDLALYGSARHSDWVDADVYRRNFIAVPLAELSPDLRLANGALAAENAAALGRDGLAADLELTQTLKELAHHESGTH
jgi:2-amino-4-hydroxy-6-hydroxymethyldihydropteridine diphosphokinase